MEYEFLLGGSPAGWAVVMDRTLDLEIMTISIREGTERDAALILDFIRQLAEYERLEHEVSATEEGLRETLFGHRPAAEVLLAEVDGESAGFAVHFGTYSTFAGKPGIYLEDLYVKPHLRGAGVGSALLRRVAQIAVERGCGRVEWGVLDWNAPSISFYRSLGAEALDQWTKYRLAGEALERLASGGAGA